MGDYGRPEPPSQTELKSARWDIARASQKAKVLMLHGNAESGESFESKTRFFKNLLQNACSSFPGGVELFYPTAPHRIQPAGSITREAGDFDAWTCGFGDYMSEVMQGYGQTIRYMLEVVRTAGPFIGIVGFSAGAATAHTLVSLAERRASPELMQNFQIDSSLLPPPFHFAICSSGFILSHPQYKSLYYPRIQTPVLHFVGNFDPIIPEDHTLKLAGRCKNRLIVYHPGAHFVPRGKIFREAMLDFVKEWPRTWLRCKAEITTSFFGCVSRICERPHRHFAPSNQHFSPNMLQVLLHIAKRAIGWEKRCGWAAALQYKLLENKSPGCCISEKSRQLAPLTCLLDWWKAMKHTLQGVFEILFQPY